MHVELETEDDFTGVMYTRGSFYKQDGPCFVRPQSRSTRKLSMNFSLDQCQTVKTNEEDLYSNVIIVQHEPDLVMPGDAAFAVECDYRKPRMITLNADLQARDRWETTDNDLIGTHSNFHTQISQRVAVGSRITLTSPDPGATQNKTPNEWDTIHSETEEVDFIPSQVDNGRKVANKNGTDQKVRGTVESIRIGDELWNGYARLEKLHLICTPKHYLFV